MAFISSIYFMDALSKIEKQVSAKYQTNVLNISHWDTSSQFQKYMLNTLSIKHNSPPWNYIYSYSIEKSNRSEIIRRLGVPENVERKKMVLLVQSGTHAILNVANLIKLHDYKNVCILRPSYFSVSHCFDVFGIDYTYEDMTFDGSEFVLPIKDIVAKRYDCIWITSPIFSTGRYYNSRQCAELNQLLSSGTLIIADESFSPPGRELTRSLTPYPNLISFYCPHKALSINGIKFSAIVCDLMYEDFLEQWVDVLSGALSKSNCDAIIHYLSDNYFACYDAHKYYINQNKQCVKEILSPYSRAHLIESAIDSGQYVTVIWEGFPSQLGRNLKFMSSLISQAKSSFYPVHLNGLMLNDLGFRINLTVSKNELSYSLSQIAAYLDGYIV